MTALAFLRALGVGLGLLTVAGAAAGAQQPSSGFGTVTGVAVDSLRGGLLPDAFVVIEGSGRGAVTGRDGVFRVDSVPPGRYRIALLHAVLDTLGLLVTTPPIDVQAGDTAWWTLAIPSARTITAAKCGNVPDTTVALFGMVSDADSGSAVEGATVTLGWLRIDIGGDIGIRATREERTATTVAGGSFKFCGLPRILAGEIQARKDRDSTGVVPVSLGDVVLGIRTLTLAVTARRDVPAGADSIASAVAATAPGSGNAVLRGRVIASKNSEAVAGAHVAVMGAAAAAITDAKGEFVMDRLPGGSRTVVVRRLGFRMAEIPVDLTSRTPREITVALDDFVPVLEEVIVRARRERGLERVGFMQRSRMGTGYFLGPDDLARRDVGYVSDWLQQAPMLRTVITDTGNRVLIGRPRGTDRGCLHVFVDGFFWEGQPDEFVNPSEVGAIEVHSAITTPPEFQRAFSPCETILIWTKHKLGMR